MQIHLNAVRVPGRPEYQEPSIVDIEVQELGRTDCLRAGECFFGIHYRPRFSCDPKAVPLDLVHTAPVVWRVRVDGDENHEALFVLGDDPDGAGPGHPDWEKNGRAPFHGGNSMLGVRTHGHDIVLVVTEGAGETYEVQAEQAGFKSNWLGPYKLATGR